MNDLRKTDPMILLTLYSKGLEINTLGNTFLLNKMLSSSLSSE